MAQAALASSLTDTPLAQDTKDEIVRSFWDPDLYDVASLDLRAYWEYYVEECRHALHDAGRHIQARTHQDIVHVASLLKKHHQRHDIRETLRLKLSKPSDNEDEILDGSIDLTARLLLMIDLGNLQYGYSGRTQLQWNEGTLKDYCDAYYSSGLVLGHVAVKLGRIFNAYNLVRIAGIELVPTNNIVDHLRLFEDDTKLYIFHHASFLKLQSKRYRALYQFYIYIRGLISIAPLFRPS